MTERLVTVHLRDDGQVYSVTLLLSDEWRGELERGARDAWRAALARAHRLIREYRGEE